MIKYINSILILILIIICGFIIYNRFLRFTSEIPTFSYKNIKNNLTVTNNDIPENKGTIIAYVSTACGGCETFIHSMNEDIKSDKTYIIVTSEKEITTAKRFFDKLSVDHRIILLNDAEYHFRKDFKLGISFTYPTLFTFDTKHKLIKVSSDF